MHPKGEIASLALFDPAWIGQQQLLDGLGLTGTVAVRRRPLSTCSQTS
jgi:hypothetical protein